jgi:hypothetical protein
LTAPPELCVIRIVDRVETKMAMMIKIPFKLTNWYASETAKRSFGSICQAVNEKGATVHLLGSEDSPLLVLDDADNHEPRPDEIEISIDEAKADWSAVTTAAALGTRFRINGKKVVRAVLFRAHGARHPAEKYLRSSSADVNLLAQKLEDLANEVRKLVRMARRSQNDRRGDESMLITASLQHSAELIDRRLRKLWRVSDGLPVARAA